MFEFHNYLYKLIFSKIIMENKKETYNIWGYEDFMDDQKKPFIARVIIGNQICEKKIYGFKLSPFFNLQNDSNSNQVYAAYGFATQLKINLTKDNFFSEIESICSSYDVIDEESPCLLSLVHEKIPVLFKRAENLKKDVDKSKSKNMTGIKPEERYPKIDEEIGLQLELKFLEKGNKVSLKDLRSRLAIKNPMIKIHLIGNIPQNQKEIIEIPTNKYFDLIEAGEFKKEYPLFGKFGGRL